MGKPSEPYRSGEPPSPTPSALGRRPRNSSILQMQEHYRELLEDSPEFLKSTYPNTSLKPAPRLDYLFFSRNLQAADGRIIEHTPGDHYPVAGRIRMEKRQQEIQNEKSGHGNVLP